MYKRQAKGKVPVTVALIESEQGLLLQRRPARGLLAGLWQPAAWEKALTRDELTAALAGIGVQAALCLLYTSARPWASCRFCKKASPLGPRPRLPKYRAVGAGR